LGFAAQSPAARDQSGNPSGGSGRAIFAVSKLADDLPDQPQDVLRIVGTVP
jgi:hypothetical protein